MMDTQRVQLAVTALLLFVTATEALSGHTVTFWNETTEDSLQCVEWNVICDVTRQHLACCRHEVIPVVRYEQVTTCAEGWLEDNNGSCDTAACDTCPSNTLCLSNGTCANFCEIYRAKTSICVCSPGFFYTPSCRLDTALYRKKMQPILTLEKVNRADRRTLSKIKLRKESPYTNRNGFNRITVTIPDLRFLEMIRSIHTIYHQHTSGVYMSFRKSDNSNRNDSMSNIPMDCTENRSTHEEICTFSKFDRFIDHGDRLGFNIRLSVTYSSTSASLITPVNRTTTVYESMYKVFDFQPPRHCTERNCSYQPLKVSPEISKGLPIHIEWNGWSDQLSGIKHYMLRVYKMAPNQAGYLRQPLDASFTMTTNNTRTDYLPSQPGVYAFLLIVEDNATNRNYARRFVLYDNTSRIDINKTNKLHFSSASKESNYHWQRNNTYITVEWRDYFVNSIHENGHFLCGIDTSPILIDNSSIIPTYDDNEGKITLTPTTNAKGIIEFEHFGPLAAAPNDQLYNDESWGRVSQISKESLHKMLPARGDGSSMKVWIKAYDLMGHTAVGSTYVFFDSSPPTANGDTAVLQKNNDQFSSSVSMEATDKESGIYQIQWDVLDTITGYILISGFTAGNITDHTAECISNIKECTCVWDGRCYLFRHYLYIDHCPIQMSKTDLLRADLTLHVRVVNYAQLTQNFTLEIGKATTMNGIKQYSHPINIRTPTLSTDSVMIAWDFEKNCYRRTGLKVVLQTQGQETGSTYNLSWNTTELEMIGLEPDTEYTATFLVHYGNESSDSFQYSFNTESVKVEEKYVVVIVIESLVALAMLIALVVTLKRLRSKRSNEEMFLPSHLSAEPIELRNRKNGYRTSTTIKQEDKKTNEKASTVRFVSGSYEETAMGKQVGDGDDDVYEDLDGHVTREPISNVTDVDFLEMISEGTLTTVFIGTCSIPTKVECAIKAPTLGVNEQEIQDFEEEASALLKFHTSHSIDASNILQYYGFVNEGQENPALIMEYCANGELGDWLGKSGDRANVDYLEQIIYDIACGMEYLAARKIFHGHLTSFNVLLNSDLVPKIKGIGDGAMSTKSARWQAPERLVGSKTEPTEAADVWSYGVIIWEIFSQGIKPYEEVAETEVEAAIKDGAKLNRPELCPDAYNGFIVTCMQRDPASRPTFTDIVDAFKSTEGSSTHPDHEDPEDSNMQPELEDSGIYQNEETAKIVT